ncbi:MAG: diguanylate cyclase [Magnetovibrio sp.]|nr:diguanylate cyclase [Magnetovibrio sp.]
MSNTISNDRQFAVRLMQHLVVPTFVLNSKGEVIIWNKACETLTGIRAEEVVGTKEHWRAFYEEPRACLADVLVEGRDAELGGLYEAYSEPGEKHQGLRAENWCVMPKAAKRLYLAINSGPIYDDDGNLIAVVETLRDMTEQKQAENALKSLAHKDGLTGLANRRTFDMTLEADLLHAKREGASIALLLCDIDHFKPYNDIYGHQRGDACLKTVAKAIADQVKRPTDLVARYGGEEFVVILPSIDQDGVMRVAERIRQSVFDLNERHKGNKKEKRVTLSIGAVCLYPDENLTEADLIEAADEALYAAKECGRNQVVAADIKS